MYVPRPSLGWPDPFFFLRPSDKIFGFYEFFLLWGEGGRVQSFDKISGVFLQYLVEIHIFWIPLTKFAFIFAILWQNSHFSHNLWWNWRFFFEKLTKLIFFWWPLFIIHGTFYFRNWSFGNDCLIFFRKFRTELSLI